MERTQICVLNNGTKECTEDNLRKWEAILNFLFSLNGRLI